LAAIGVDELGVGRDISWHPASALLDAQNSQYGYARLETVNHGYLIEAVNFVRTLQKRQCLQAFNPDDKAGMFNEKKFN